MTTLPSSECDGPSPSQLPATHYPRRYRPFQVLWDKANRRWYINPPKHLAGECKGEKLSSTIQANMKTQSMRLKAKFAGRLERPRRKPRNQACVEAALSAEVSKSTSFDQPSMANSVEVPATVKAPNDAAEVLYAECVALGYSEPLTAILKEKRDFLLALKTERTLEQVRESFACWLEHPDQNRPDQAKLVRQMELPWKEKRLGEFFGRARREEAIVEVEKFLAERYNFLDGQPWSSATKVGWISRFCLTIEHAINRSYTDLPFNFFRKALSRPEFDIAPIIFSMERLQEFMTYVFYWHAELYVAFVLATWACIRIEEIDKIRWEMIDLDNGTIILDDSITKMGDTRTILETDVPNVFALLRAVPHLIKKAGRLVKNSNWKNHLFYAYRELTGEPWPGNVLRSTGASAILVLTNMPTCGRVMGHRFEGIDEILLKWYRKHMTPAAAAVFAKMVPEPLSSELEARYKHRLYRAVVDLTLSTHMWPNYAVKGQHTVGMNSAGMVELLRKKRPIFAQAIGREVAIEIIHLDGATTSTKISTSSRKTARKMVHRIRVALLTGQGVIDVKTAQVEHYERNYGPCLGQRLFRITNGSELLKQMEDRRMNVRDVARRVGTSIDVLCRYFTMGSLKNRTRYLPENHKLKLEAMFSNLIFEAVEPPSDVLAWICAGAPSSPKLQI